MGTPFRVPYGFALGRENHFSYRYAGTESGTAGLIKKQSTTADVTTGVLFYTDNTAATTITALTCNTYSSNTGYQDGRVIRIVMLDTATQLSQAGNIVLAGSGNFGASGNAPMAIDLMQMKGKWYEMSRMPYDMNQDYSNVNLAGTTNCSVNANGVSTFVVTQTSTATQLSAISGGYIGQLITIVFARSTTSVATITTGGNIILTNGTGGSVGINTGGAVQLIKATATSWYLLDSQR